MERESVAEMEAHEKTLLALLPDVARAQDLSPFLRGSLNIQIYKDLLHIQAALEADQLGRRERAESLAKTIYKLLLQARDYDETSRVYALFAEETSKAKKGLQDDLKRFWKIRDFSKTAFDQTVWPLTRAATDSIVRDKEERLYAKMVPVDKLILLDSFLMMAPYDPEAKTYNHKAEEAFLVYQKIFTADGEARSMDRFKTLTEQKNKLWQRLYADQKTAFEAQRAQRSGWQNILYGVNPSTTALKRVLREAAPLEIAFVALQRLVHPMLQTGDYSMALRTIGAQKPYFNDRGALSVTAQKVELLREAIEEKQRLAQEQTVRETKILATENPELAFFFNYNKSYLALLPLKDGPIRRYKVNKNGEIEETRRFSGALPKSYFYNFAKIPKHFDSLEKTAIDRLFSDPKRILQDGSVSDLSLWRSGNQKILLFSAVPNQPEDHAFFTDACPYPGFGADIRTFQEYGHNQAYHGKRVGNPNTDIYYVIYNDDGSSLPPRRLPGLCNTPYSERAPVLSADGNKIYFASEGHAGLGGYDVFSIDIEHYGKDAIRAVGQPLNLTEANSADDDVFYAPLNDSTWFVTSNRAANRNFDLYQVAARWRSLTEAPDDSEARGTPKTVADDTPIEFDGVPIGFSAVCGELVEPDPDFPNGQIEVKGRVFYKGQPAEAGRIVFYDRDGNKYPETVDAQGYYTLWVPYEKKEFRVVVTVSPKGSQDVQGFKQDFIVVCDNSSKSKYVEKNIKINGKEIEGGEIDVPFLFRSNVYRTFICKEKLMRGYYEGAWDVYKERKGNFICYGYADTTGSQTYNLDLARRRAEYVRDFLINIGYDPGRIFVQAVGETSDFDPHKNREAFEAYVRKQTFSLDEFVTDFQRELLFNRRVAVHFVPPK